MNVKMRSITNNVDDKCFIVIVHEDDNDEYLNRQLHQARRVTMRNALHTYLLEHDPVQYHITEVSVDTYDRCDEYVNKLKQITDSTPNCINSTSAVARMLEERMNASRVKALCSCGAHVLKSSMPKHILTSRHKNAINK